MYVECLKKQVAELLAKQQQLQHGVFEPLSGRQAEEITLRKAVVQTFLEYRTTDVRDHAKWCDIVDDDFLLLLPHEPYRACAVGEQTMKRKSTCAGSLAGVVCGLLSD